jgi:phage tail sheath protein FI
MALNIGLNVIEVDGSATPAITGAAVSVAGFAVLTSRGVPNRPVRITTFAQFTERFGGYSPSALGAYLVNGFFDNGGQFAYISRMGGAGAAAPVAAGTVLPAGSTGVAQLLGVTAGYRGDPDPGAWGNALSVASAPSFSTTVTGASVAAGGASLASVTGLSAGDTVALTQGANHAVVTLTAIVAATKAVTWAPDLVTVFDAATTTVSSTDFDLTVSSTAGGPATVVETWARLSLARDAANYAPVVLNDLARGSRYLRLVDPRASSVTGPDTPGASSAALAGGNDGTISATDIIGDQGAHTGLHSFDAVDIQLLATERSDPVIVEAALTYCEDRGEAMFVGSVPAGAVGGGTAIDYGAQFQGKKVYGALYGPWITVADPLSKAATPIRSLPPTGHVLGVYARTESTRGIHKAPAGDDARLLGALDVEYRLSDAELTDLVKTGSVNGVRPVTGAGIVVDASRTLSTDPRWYYVNVRLLFNYVKASLRQGLRWVRQEPNRDTLWNSVKHGSVRPFLLGLWGQGAFGTGQPADVFTVICDATNNPPDEVDKGNFHVEVYFYPSKPAETIVITIGQQPSGASATES